MKIGEIVQTEKWKSFMAYLYGWGASLVIVGALFKLMHWPYAGAMLVLGMGTEAIIFFFSAFEPVHEEYDWKLVYPELAIKDEETLEKIRRERKTEGIATPTTSGGNVNLPNLDVAIDKGSIDKVNNGLSQLADAASKIADMTNITLSVNNLSERLQQASAGVEVFNGQIGESSQKLGNSVDQLSNSYLHGMDMVKVAGSTLVDGVKAATDSLSVSLKESASSMSTHFEKAGITVENTIKESSKELSQKIAESSGSLANSFDRISKQVIVDMEAMKSGNGNQQKNLEALNKSLATLNSVYEIQIQETDKHLKNANVLYSDVENLVKDLRLSVDETQKFRQTMHTLNANITSLNDVYGNMLSAIHSIHNN